MESYESNRKARSGRARDRQSAREQRRRETAMATPHAGNAPSSAEPSARRSRNRPKINLADVSRGLQLWLRDARWYITHRPVFAQGAVFFATALFLMFAASHVFGGRIFPNVWVAGVHVGDLTVEEAQLAISEAWASDIKIALYVEGEKHVEVSPLTLGLEIDAAAAAQTARNVGMSGIPFGYSIEPSLTLTYQTAQRFLLDKTADINTLPFNAGYEIRDGQVVGVAGREGREMDITGTMDYLQNHLDTVLRSRRLNILTLPLMPRVRDPEPFLTDVQSMISQQFALVGYDPFTDTSVAWSTSPEEFVGWLEAGTSRLTVREEAFKAFISTLNEQIAVDDPNRFIDEEEAILQIDAAIEAKSPTIYLRFMHKPEQYVVNAGDGGFRISRKTGIPFFLIDQANPGIEWETLSVGQTINLPSKDLTLPEPPVATKRIVVDLNKQLLVAFENGEEKFRWLISSGMYDAPTSPGIYQIQSHDEIAYGSSYTLCDEALSCGQWKMYWFMGIYEVQPGLMNGFHGAVELPNGAYLGGGNVGEPYTFGCVMSEDGNAQMLFEWAEHGTVVEIVSNEFEPRSEAGWQVYNESDNSL